MAVDIKPSVTPIKQMYVTKGNSNKQSMYGNSYNAIPGFTKRHSTNANGLTIRIKSALLPEQQEGYGFKDHRGMGSHTSYTRFRPVTSHPTTSLLASLYKQQTFAESRNAQAASKLPTIYHNRALIHSSKSNRELKPKPFVSPAFSATNPTVTKSQPSGNKPAQKPGSRSAAERDLESKNEAVGASDTWNAVHDSILASGQAIFNETQTTAQSNAKNPSADVSKTLPSRPSVNYVPFYEIRGRGDGASVVDIPSIDIEGKKIEKTNVVFAQNDEKKKHALSTARTHQHHNAAKPAIDEASASKKSDEQSSVKVAESNDNASSSHVSSMLRPHKNAGDKSSTPTKVEKKVRFSGMITTNKISEEPSYTETLIHSMHKSFKQHNYLNTVHKTVAATIGSLEYKDSDSRPGDVDSVGASSRVTAEEDDQAYVTPVMKVVVTKRETPAGAEQLDSVIVSPRETQLRATPLQVKTVASKIINNQSALPDKGIQTRLVPRPLTTAEVIRKGTQATQRASTAGYARNNEAIARVVKLIPKRQTVIMPNFTRQPAWTSSGPVRNFPPHGKGYKLAGSGTRDSPAFSASVQGNSFNQQQPKEIKFKQSSPNPKDNLRSRLVSSGGSGLYTSSTRQAKFSTLPADDRKKTINGDLAATPLIALPTMENVSQVGLLSPRLFTDFQPIPSMPDHINFCDPRKTELILHWLEDVNKKRNMESRLRRVGLSK